MARALTQDQRVARFWSLVDKTGDCWLWTGPVNGHGYGMTSLVPGEQSAHRASFALENGPIGKGVFVCHTCDQPPCVRPSHLYGGNALTNARDAVARGRFNRFKPTDPAVQARNEKLVAMFLGGATRRECAETFGVSISVASTAIGRATYGEAPESISVKSRRFMKSRERARLGHALCGLRHRAGLSVNDLSIAAGVSAGAIGRYESGRISPTWDRVLKLLKALGSTSAELLEAARSGGSVAPSPLHVSMPDQLDRWLDV